jgi:HAD superfamily hydrolase (TIGR01490 family)
MNEKIAFFDIDHTIVKRSTAEYFIFEALRRGLRLEPLLFTIPGLYFGYRFRNVSWDTWHRRIPGVAGHSSELLRDIASSCFERRCRAAIYPEMRELIASLRSRGISVWFATSSVDLIVRPLVDEFGADGLIASELEFEGGASTGRFSGKPVFGVEKLNRVVELAGSLSVDVADCSFHSDSVHDLPLLEACGKAVAVNPDHRLSRIARERGWETLRCRR